MSVAGWFESHPEAVEAVLSWLEQRAAGEKAAGSRAIVELLRDRFQFPFRDHTSLQDWARYRFPSRYAAAKAAHPARRPAPPREPSFRRSDSDVREIEARADFFVTCAVEESPVNEGFLRAVQHWCNERGGALIVNPIKYRNPTRRREEERDRRERWWDSKLADYMLDNELRPHPELCLMATKAQATAHNPLPARVSGRTKHRSAVFGHPQLSMRTVATPQAKLPKILYSSGAITDKNYSDTLSGDMAQFHHSLGGIIVEIRGDRFHLREVVWDGKGFSDCDQRYTARGIQKAPPVEALVMGDIHAPHYVADNVMEATFGNESIYDALRPRRLFLHDLADNRAVNPHEAKNRLTRAALAGASDLLDVRRELEGVAEWLNDLPWFREVLVTYSNHDDFLYRWLERAQPEPQNAKLYHRLCYLMLDEHERTGKFPPALEVALREAAFLPKQVRFLDADESYQVAGVECAMHGHLGPNGARGSLRNLSYIGTRSIFGHVHSPGIWQGAYAVGLSAEYQHGYNSGPSSWLQSHGVVHANGYRQLLHIIGDQWRG